MRQFSVWEALVRAPMLSGDLHRDVGRNWRGIGLRLLLLVLVITWAIEGVKMHRGLTKFAREEAPGFVQDFPPITIQDGVVSSTVPQPYYWKVGKEGKEEKTFAVVDTTGEITSLDQTDAMILVTVNKLHYRDNNNAGQVKIQDLSQIKSFFIDRARVQGWIDMLAKCGALVLIPIAFIFSFIYRLIQGLIYGAIGLIWNSSFNANLSYAALMRLAFVSVTPVILLDTLVTLIGVNVPMFSFICLIIAMVYLALAVKSNAQPVQAMYGQQPYGMPGQPFPQQQFPQPPFPQQGFPQQQQPYPGQPQYPQPPQYPPNPPQIGR